VVKNNGFNPIWENQLALPFEVVGGMKELVFVRFAVKDAGGEGDDVGVYCASLACLKEGEYLSILIY
jgi:phosphatidylinositol phospholipase C delta